MGMHSVARDLTVLILDISRHLKTFYFQSVYPPPCLEYLCPHTLIILRLALCKPFTYLLSVAALPRKVKSRKIC